MTTNLVKLVSLFLLLYLSSVKAKPVHSSKIQKGCDRLCGPILSDPRHAIYLTRVQILQFEACVSLCGDVITVGEDGGGILRPLEEVDYPFVNPDEKWAWRKTDGSGKTVKRPESNGDIQSSRLVDGSGVPGSHPSLSRRPDSPSSPPGGTSTQPGKPRPQAGTLGTPGSPPTQPGSPTSSENPPGTSGSPASQAGGAPGTPGSPTSQSGQPGTPSRPPNQPEQPVSGATGSPGSASSTQSGGQTQTGKPVGPPGSPGSPPAPPEEQPAESPGSKDSKKPSKGRSVGRTRDRVNPKESEWKPDSHPGQRETTSSPSTQTDGIASKLDKSGQPAGPPGTPGSSRTPEFSRITEPSENANLSESGQDGKPQGPTGTTGSRSNTDEPILPQPVQAEQTVEPPETSSPGSSQSDGVGNQPTTQPPKNETVELLKELLEESDCPDVSDPINDESDPAGNVPNQPRKCNKTGTTTKSGTTDALDSSSLSQATDFTSTTETSTPDLGSVLGVADDDPSQDIPAEIHFPEAEPRQSKTNQTEISTSEEELKQLYDTELDQEHSDLDPAIRIPPEEEAENFEPVEEDQQPDPLTQSEEELAGGNVTQIEKDPAQRIPKFNEIPEARNKVEGESEEQERNLTKSTEDFKDEEDPSLFTPGKSKIKLVEDNSLNELDPDAKDPALVIPVKKEKVHGKKKGGPIKGRSFGGDWEKDDSDEQSVEEQRKRTDPPSEIDSSEVEEHDDNDDDPSSKLPSDKRSRKPGNGTGTENMSGKDPSAEIPGRNRTLEEEMLDEDLKETPFKEEDPSLQIPKEDDEDQSQEKQVEQTTRRRKVEGTGSDEDPSLDIPRRDRLTFESGETETEGSPIADIADNEIIPAEPAEPIGMETTTQIEPLTLGQTKLPGQLVEVLGTTTSQSGTPVATSTQSGEHSTSGQIGLPEQTLGPHANTGSPSTQSDRQTTSEPTGTSVSLSTQSGGQTTHEKPVQTKQTVVGTTGSSSTQSGGPTTPGSSSTQSGRETTPGQSGQSEQTVGAPATTSSSTSTTTTSSPSTHSGVQSTPLQTGTTEPSSTQSGGQTTSGPQGTTGSATTQTEGQITPGQTDITPGTTGSSSTQPLEQSSTAQPGASSTSRSITDETISSSQSGQTGQPTLPPGSSSEPGTSSTTEVPLATKPPATTQEEKGIDPVGTTTPTSTSSQTVLSTSETTSDSPAASTTSVTAAMSTTPAVETVTPASTTSSDKESRTTSHTQPPSVSPETLAASTATSFNESTTTPIPTETDARTTTANITTDEAIPSTTPLLPDGDCENEESIVSDPQESDPSQKVPNPRRKCKSPEINSTEETPPVGMGTTTPTPLITQPPDSDMEGNATSPNRTQEDSDPSQNIPGEVTLPPEAPSPPPTTESDVTTPDANFTEDYEAATVTEMEPAEANLTETDPAQRIPTQEESDHLKSPDEYFDESSRTEAETDYAKPKEMDEDPAERIPKLEELPEEAEPTSGEGMGEEMKGSKESELSNEEDIVHEDDPSLDPPGERKVKPVGAATTTENSDLVEDPALIIPTFPTKKPVKKKDAPKGRVMQDEQDDLMGKTLKEGTSSSEEKDSKKVDHEDPSLQMPDDKNHTQQPEPDQKQQLTSNEDPSLDLPGKQPGLYLSWGEEPVTVFEDPSLRIPEPGEAFEEDDQIGREETTTTDSGAIQDEEKIDEDSPPSLSLPEPETISDSSEVVETTSAKSVPNSTPQPRQPGKKTKPSNINGRTIKKAASEEASEEEGGFGEWDRLTADSTKSNSSTSKGGKSGDDLWDGEPSAEEGPSKKDEKKGSKPQPSKGKVSGRNLADAEPSPMETKTTPNSTQSPPQAKDIEDTENTPPDKEPNMFTVEPGEDDPITDRPTYEELWTKRLKQGYRSNNNKTSAATTSGSGQNGNGNYEAESYSISPYGDDPEDKQQPPREYPTDS